MSSWGWSWGQYHVPLWEKGAAADGSLHCVRPKRGGSCLSSESSPEPKHARTPISDSENPRTMNKKKYFLLLKPSSLWYFTTEAWTAIPLRVKAKVYPTARGLTHSPCPQTLTAIAFDSSRPLSSSQSALHAIPCQAYSHLGGLCFLSLDRSKIFA